MGFLMTVLYILLFLVFLSVLIIIHELGHLAAAKAFKVYCLEYSIGMGPLLFKHKRKNGETQFSIRAIPFGGYVSMYGEGVELPEGVEIPESRSLNGIKPWKRAIILLAGVTMNAILALVFFFTSNCFDKTLFINSLNIVPDSIAAKGENPIPDGVIFNITETFYDDPVAEVRHTFYVFDEAAYINGDDTVKYAATINLESLKSYNERDLADFLYVYPIDGDTIDFANLVEPKTINYVDLHFSSKTLNENKEVVDGPVYQIRATVKDNAYESFGCLIYYGRTYQNFGEIVQGTFTKFGSSSILLFQAIGDLFTKPSTWGNVGGIVAVGFETTSILQNFGFAKFLFYWGFISVNLAIFNLLPFPGLDGWQLLVLIIESTTRKKIPEKVKNIVSFVGIGLLLLLMGVIVVKDLIKYVFAGICLL